MCVRVFVCVCMSVCTCVCVLREREKEYADTHETEIHTLVYAHAQNIRHVRSCERDHVRNAPMRPRELQRRLR